MALVLGVRKVAKHWRGTIWRKPDGECATMIAMTADAFQSENDAARAAYAAIEEIRYAED
jgi:hypothetical protein